MDSAAWPAAQPSASDYAQRRGSAPADLADLARAGKYPGYDQQPRASHGAYESPRYDDPQQYARAPAQQQQQQQQHQQHHAHHMALEDAAQDAASRDNGKAGMAVRRPNGHSQPGLPPHHGSQNPSMQNPSMHGQMGNPNMMGMLHSGHAGAGLPQQRHGDVQGQQHLMQQGLANEAFARAQQARALPGAPSDAATLSAARSRRPAKAYQN
mmetsp:Transcript_3220/g.11528  ORF Transcript_3220/g.11528 Transcript_3220/m.11528 type:complete len:211 (-) Transcript_3220:222-854(-)